MRQILILFIISFLSCSSPYYNTLYNAEKLYKSGERLAPRALLNRKSIKYNSTLTVGKLNAKNADLEKVLEKCAGVLIEFGDTQEQNSYADESYYLMIKSSFYLERYDECVQIIARMEDKTPQSQYLNEVYIYKGDALAHLGNYSAAVSAFSLVDEDSDPDIYAESIMGRAKIFETQNQPDQAIEILKNFYEKLKENDQVDKLSELRHFNLLDYITDLEINSNQVEDIISATDNYRTFDELEYKKRLAIKRLTAITRSGNPTDLNTFIDEVDDDTDLSPEADFIDFIELVKNLEQMTDSILSFQVARFERLNPASQFLTNLYSMYINHLKANNANPDTLQKVYAKLLIYEKDPDKKSVINTEFNNHKKFVNIYQGTKLIEKMKAKLDSMIFAFENNELLDSIRIDSNRIKKLNDEILQKEISNHWGYASYYYENNEKKLAQTYFEDIIEIETDTLKHALAILFLAQITEATNQNFADSLYRYAYLNFDHLKNNIDLIDKLKIPMETIQSKSDKLYRDFMNKIDLDATPYSTFKTGYELIVDSLQEKSEAKEKLLFNRIYILLRENEMPDSTIHLITNFKKTYPKSSMLTYLNRYDLIKQKEIEEITKDTTKSEENLSEIEENPDSREFDDMTAPNRVTVSSKFENESNIQMLSEVKEKYPYNQTLAVDVELSVNAQGDVVSILLLNSNALDVKAKIDNICKSLKFNTYDQENRKFKLTINLGDLR